MNILKKIDDIERFNQFLNESGVSRIRSLAKKYNKAIIYFHMDTDGVTTAIAVKQYLKNYGIKVVQAEPINYGSKEYSIPKPQKGLLAVMVDFAHGKPMIQIHTDHHGGQVGFAKTASTNFVNSPSNVAFISQILSPSDLFPPADIDIINMVDSADFARLGLQPDDIMRAVYHTDKDLDVTKNRRAMGLVVNKLLLSYKNRSGFLSSLVMKSKPSLLSIYNVIKKLAKENGYVPPEELEKKGRIYRERQKNHVKIGDINDVKKLSNGESILIGTTIVQYGGGFMSKGGYDRYTPFKLYPDAEYYTIIWPYPTSLLQLSKNPFQKGKNPIHLGDLVIKKILPKFKSRIQKYDISLYTIKRTFEYEADKKNIKQATGFTFDDFIALFNKKAKNLPDKGSWKELIEKLSNKRLKWLSYKQKELLKRITVNLWDIIISQSGGHADITNLSGSAFIGKESNNLLKDIQFEIAKVMKDKHLQ